MNDDLYFLANAYVDGELTAGERGIAEADPEVMAEVEQLRALQASLRAVDAPSAAAREAAIGAAMAEFGRSPARPVAPPIPFRPRPVYARFLGVAAAVVVVGMLAVVVGRAGIGGGGDDDSSAPAASVSDEGASEPTAESALTESVAEADSAADSEAVMVAEDPAEDTAEMSAAPAAADDVAGAAESDDPTRSAGTFARPEIDPEQPLVDELELGSFGTYLLEEQRANRIGATPNTDCPPAFNILGETVFILDDVETPIYVAVQTDDGLVLGLDTETCTILVEGPLF